MTNQPKHDARRTVSLYLFAVAFTVAIASAAPASAQSLYVSSRGTNNGVFRFDSSTGAFVHVIVPRGRGGENLPDGIVIGPDGALYVASNEMGGDNSATAVLRFDANTGAFLGEFVARRYGNITDIVFGPNGNLFVSNFPIRVIEEFDGTTGGFLRAFATQPAAHCCPQALVFGPTGNLFVAYESGVEEFHGTTGALVKAFATGQWAYGLAFAPDGTLLVSTAGSGGDNVQKYDPVTGMFVGVLVPAGTLSIAPTIKFGPDGRLYVADRGNRRILRFEWPTGNLVDIFVPPLSGGMDDPINLTFGPAVPFTTTTRGSWRRPAFAVDRYTAFESALPLLPGDTNGVTDVYVHDDVANTLHRMSVSTLGQEAIGGESVRAAISANGRFVAFESLASNLVYGDTNGQPDVFLHDRDADENGVFDQPGGMSTTRISVSSTGDQAIGGSSTWASISGNGRIVAFQSAATNLDAGDVNGAADVFVHDRLLARTRRVSVATDGTTATAGASLRPAISQNGRYVAFDSAAVLTAGDSNGARDVFVHDRDFDADGLMDETGAVATRRVSVASSGAEATGGDSVDASITNDGRYVVFASSATPLVPSDTNAVSDVFVHDRDADADGMFDEPGAVATRRLSVGAGGSQLAVPSGVPRISANGRLLVFLVAASPSVAVAPGHNAVAAAVVGSDPGKSVPGRLPDPTNPAPQPPVIDEPLPTGPDSDLEDPSTSPDGDVWGGTETQGAPSVVIVEGPEDTRPYITSVVPVQGPDGGGTRVTIEGRDLAGTLYWHGAALAPLTQSATRWTLVTPPRGGAPVAVTLSIGTAAFRSNEQTFTYGGGSTPRWTSHTPLSGTVGGSFSLTITGTGFATPTVRLGPFAAPVTASTPTSITVAVPASYVAGPVPVVVTNGDGAETTSDVPFTYQNGDGPVSVVRVDPEAAAAVGGTAVTIFGAGFTAGTTVTFGGQPGTALQLLSSRALVVQAPPASPGPATLTVSVPGQAPASIPFVYVAPPDFPPGCTGPDNDGDGIDDAWGVQYGLAAGDAADDPDHDGSTNLQECQRNTHPRGTYARYLAEGATGAFFDTRIALANPNATPARVLLRFQLNTGATHSRFLLLPPMSRRSVRPALVDGLASVAGLSTVIESDVEIVVDRTVEWGLGASTGIYGSHAETSLSAPRTTWYLAEGATHGDFDLFYLLQNPGATAAVVRVRFLRPAGLAPIERDYTVPPHQRVTLNVDTVPGLEATDVSAVFRSMNDVPIIVERAMYRTIAGSRPFEAGHDSAAVAAPSTHWFLAEGATGVFFDTYLLLANPNDAVAQVSVTYLMPGSATVVRAYEVAGNSRRTIHVASEAVELAATSVSMVVTVTNSVSIIAARAMWWPGLQAAAANPSVGPFWGEAHNSPGAIETGTKWAVADGETGPAPTSATTYYLIANTSSFAADVSVTLLSETNRQPSSRRFTVAANSRFTVGVADEFPETRQDGSRTYGAVIESLPLGGQPPAQIVVERAMYSNSNAVFWAAGSNLLATRLR